jgi:LAO/AO transport system kinase
VTRTAPPGPDIARLAQGIRAGERAIIGRAITLIESRRADHQRAARHLLQGLLPDTGGAVRLGITGTPGVGKSTTIDALGTFLTGNGHKVAVLAVDPSSTRTGGSILADKTRMARLSADPNAFVRPSPSSGTLGGVAAKTREGMLVCEAAGYDVILVETVGTGQSETAVADMTDFFLVLTLPGAGDELQGIKKGIIEQADMVAVNKADADPARARQAAAEYGSALRILAPASPDWTPPVRLVSGLANQGLIEMWGEIERHRAAMSASGELRRKRARQQIKWMWALLEEGLMRQALDNGAVKAKLAEIERAVGQGALAPEAAAEQILVLAKSP